MLCMHHEVLRRFLLFLCSDGETIGEETVTSSKDIENTEPPSRNDGADNISALTK